MGQMVAVYVTVLYLLNPPTAGAVEKMSRFFGLKFGQTLKDSSILNKVGSPSDFEEIYSVDPPLQNSLFEQYRVSVDNSTRVIFRIEGVGPPESITQCTAEMKAMASHLKKNYNYSADLFGGAYFHMDFTNEISLWIRCLQNKDAWQLSLSVTHLGLLYQFEEQIELEKKQPILP